MPGCVNKPAPSAADFYAQGTVCTETILPKIKGRFGAGDDVRVGEQHIVCARDVSDSGHGLLLGIKLVSVWINKEDAAWFFLARQGHLR